MPRELYTIVVMIGAKHRTEWPSGRRIVDSTKSEMAKRCRLAPLFLRTDDLLETVYRGRVVVDAENDRVNVMTFTGEVEDVVGDTIENYVAHAFEVGRWAGKQSLPADVFYETDELPLSGAIIAGNPEDIEAYLLEQPECLD